MDYKKIILGFLAFMIASSVIYIQLANDVKFRIDEDSTTLYLKDLNEAGEPEGRWKVAGREYSKIMDGSSNTNRRTSEIYIETAFKDENGSLTILRDNKEITESQWMSEYNSLKPNQFMAKRYTPYIRGHITIDTYIFDGTLKDVTLVPLKHTIQVLNGEGLFLRYYIDDIYAPEEKRKLDGETEVTFDRLKVEFEEGYRWAWIGYPYGKDSFAVQYDIKSNDEVFELRLFDPPATPEILPDIEDYEVYIDFNLENANMGSTYQKYTKPTRFVNDTWQESSSGGSTILDDQRFLTNGAVIHKSTSPYGFWSADDIGREIRINITYDVDNATDLLIRASNPACFKFDGATTKSITPGNSEFNATVLCATNFVLDPNGLTDTYAIYNITQFDILRTSPESFTDQSGGNDATISASSSKDFDFDDGLNGETKGSLVFDGIDQSFASTMNFGNKNTIRIKVKPATTNPKYILDKGYISGFILYRNLYTGDYKAFLNISGTDYTSEFMPIVADQWEDIFIVHDGNRIKIYSNGVEKTNIPASGILNNTGSSIRIGSRAFNDNYFNGSIAHLSIIHEALSETQIKLLTDEEERPSRKVYNTPHDSYYEAKWELKSSELTEITDFKPSPLVNLELGDVSVTGDVINWNGSGYVRNNVDAIFTVGNVYRFTLDTTVYDGTPNIYIQRLIDGSDLIIDDNGVGLGLDGLHIATATATRTSDNYLQIQNNVAGVNVTMEVVSIEESPNAFEDLSGNNYNATGNKFVEFTTDETGKENSAVTFDGTDDYIDTDYDFNGIENLSVEFWYNPNDITTMGIMGQSNMRIMVSNGRFRIYAYNETTATQVILSDLIDYNEWQYVVVNKDSDGWEYWLNGELKDTSTLISGPLKSIVSADFRIGYPSADYALFNGSISKVGIMNRPMTESEIIANYKGVKPVKIKTPVSNGLVFSAETTSPNFKGDRFVAPGPFEIETYNINKNMVTQEGTEMTGVLYTRQISVPDTTGSALDLTDEFTLEAVVKLDNRINYNCLITKGDNFAYNQQNYGLCFDATITTIIVNKTLVQNSYDFPTGEWIDVVATWNGSDAKLYVNGELKFSGSYTGTITPDNQHLRLGGFYNQEDIDGIYKVGRVYNRALTEEEIQRNYEVEKIWWT